MDKKLLDVHPNGIYWTDGVIKPRISWSDEYGVYKHLSEIFKEFEEQFKISISPLTKEFELSKEQINFLENRVEAAINNLIGRINEPRIHTGFNFIDKKYKNQTLRLYYIASRLHELLMDLILFYDFLQEGTRVFCVGVLKVKS